MTVGLLGKQYTNLYRTALLSGITREFILDGSTVVGVDLIILTAVVVRLVDIGSRELNLIHQRLLVSTQVRVCLSGDCLTDAVRRITTGERYPHDIALVVVVEGDADRCVVVLLVRHSLELLTRKHLVRCHRLGSTVIVNIYQILLTLIGCLIIYRLLGCIDIRLLVVVVERYIAGVVRIDEQVERIVVEMEFLTVLR